MNQIISDFDSFWNIRIRDLRVETFCYLNGFFRNIDPTNKKLRDELAAYVAYQEKIVSSSTADKCSDYGDSEETSSMPRSPITLNENSCQTDDYSSLHKKVTQKKDGLEKRPSSPLPEIREVVTKISWADDSSSPLLPVSSITYADKLRSCLNGVEIGSRQLVRSTNNVCIDAPIVTKPPKKEFTPPKNDTLLYTKTNNRILIPIIKDKKQVDDFIKLVMIYYKIESLQNYFTDLANSRLKATFEILKEKDATQDFVDYLLKLSCNNQDVSTTLFETL